MQPTSTNPAGGGDPRPDRRSLLTVAAGVAGAVALGRDAQGNASVEAPAVVTSRNRAAGPLLVGSANALPGMRQHYAALQGGAEPLGVAIDVVKVVEADPEDHSVGLGGLPDERGVVTLDAACMHGPTHNAGAVACVRDVLHVSEVARLVMERTDHVLLVGEGATRFAHEYGHPRAELLTPEAREIWLAWREQLSEGDDRLAPPVRGGRDEKHGKLYRYMGEELTLADLLGPKRITGTIHCSALAGNGDLACTTTTSGMAFKVPGRVGDSPLVGAGLYCDQGMGSAGGTGRGESAILSCASFLLVQLMGAGASPTEAGLEVLRRVTEQARRAAAWQPGLVRADGLPSFNLQLYALTPDGAFGGVTLFGEHAFSVADPEHGPRHERLVTLHT